MKGKATSLRCYSRVEEAQGQAAALPPVIRPYFSTGKVFAAIFIHSK